MERQETSKRWLKAELHSHCSADPDDFRICEYAPEQLIAEAARLGYDVLAITCHNLDIWNRDLSEYAESLGITLIPGMEATVEGRKHVLAYNFHTGCENLNTLEKIRAHRREDTLVIAPHPYYPFPTCLRGLLQRNLELFDALEISGFHTRYIDFNNKTQRLGRGCDKPLVGNSDVHRLWQLGRTWSWIYAEPRAGSVIRAIKEGHVQVHREPITLAHAARWWSAALWGTLFPVNPAPRRSQPIPA